MLAGLRSRNGRIHPSVALVRAVNFAVWLVVFPFASPVAFYMAGRLPLWFQKAALVMGSAMIAAVPVAAPQYAQSQPTPSDIRRLEKNQEKLSELMGRLQDNQIVLGERVLRNELRATQQQKDHEEDQAKNDEAHTDFVDEAKNVRYVLVFCTLVLVGAVRFTELAKLARKAIDSNAVVAVASAVSAMFKHKTG